MRVGHIVHLIYLSKPMIDKAEPGAQVFSSPTDDELIARAVANLVKVFSPRLLYRFSVIALNRHAVGLGEIRLLWMRGRLDTITDSESHKAHLLEEQSLIECN